MTRYARENGVSIIGHHETGGDAADYETRVDEAFDLQILVTEITLSAPAANPAG